MLLLFTDRVVIADPTFMTRDGPILGDDTLALVFHKEERHFKPPTLTQILGALSLIHPVDGKIHPDTQEKLIQLGWIFEYLDGREDGAPECPRCSLCEGRENLLLPS